MRKLIRSQWALIGAAVLFVGTIAIVLAAELRKTDGHLVYALDDAYIHMAMAKNLARFGTYGVTEYEFSSSSSSPLWTLTLASVNSIFGVHEILPFVLNLILGLAILAVLRAYLRQAKVDAASMAVALVAIIYATPMPAMVFSGMEHLLHILLTIPFLWVSAEMITTEGNRDRTPRHVSLFLLAAALVLVRYESYALLVITGAFFVVRRRWMVAGGLLLAGVLPLVAYQAISVSAGWSWLPNSVFLRQGASNAGAASGSGDSGAVSPGLSCVQGVLDQIVGNLGAGLPLVALMVIAAVLLLVAVNRRPSFWSRHNVMATVFILAGLSHLMFGHIGHFFRYEAYLIATGLFASACLIPEVAVPPGPGSRGVWRRSFVVPVLGVSFIPAFILLTTRSMDSLELTPDAGRNIFEQQYQMGMFLQRYYPAATIALNDIGAVSFLSRVRVLDLAGLASIDVLRHKRAGEYDAGRLQELCHKYGVRIAIVYDSWLQRIDDRGGPLRWTKIGEWRILENVVCSDDIVSFYAVDPSETKALDEKLRQFSAFLPANVVQTGSYVENAGRSVR